jgi:hypothetical protein
MKRRTLIVVALFLATLLSPAGARALGVHDVIKLHQQQVSDSLIVLAIQNSHQVIHVTSDDFRQLKKAGVSDQVMSAMLRTEQVGFQKNAANHQSGVNQYGWSIDPYAGSYPGPYAPPGSSVSLSFSYGYGGYLWPYYGPYYYRPFVVRPYFGIHAHYPYRRW